MRIYFIQDSEFNFNMNGRNVTCKNGLHFDDNNTSNISFNEYISISHDNIFGINFEPEKESMNDVYLIPLEECGESEGSRNIILQEIHADVPLVSF